MEILDWLPGALKTQEKAVKKKNTQAVYQQISDVRIRIRIQGFLSWIRIKTCKRQIRIRIQEKIGGYEFGFESGLSVRTHFTATWGLLLSVGFESGFGFELPGFAHHCSKSKV